MPVAALQQRRPHAVDLVTEHDTHGKTGSPLEEIDGELGRLTATLRSENVGISILGVIDAAFAGIARPVSLSKVISTFLRLQRMKSQLRNRIHALIQRSHVPPGAAERLRKAASTRASLLQKTLLLSRVERLFFYWHAIHLPFTVIMFITLALHITVVLLLGYTWIF